MTEINQRGQIGQMDVALSLLAVVKSEIREANDAFVYLLYQGVDPHLEERRDSLLRRDGQAIEMGGQHLHCDHLIYPSRCFEGDRFVL